MNRVEMQRLIGIGVVFLLLLARILTYDPFKVSVVPLNPSEAYARPALGPSPGSIALNLASAKELELLPGIGPSLAARILEHRQTHGPFKSLEELLAVKGIGPKTLEKIRPYLRLE